MERELSRGIPARDFLVGGDGARQVEPAIPLLQSLLQVAPWVVGAAALAGIAYMIWARIDDRRRGLR